MKPKSIVLEAPCDIYNSHARDLHYAIQESGGEVFIEKLSSHKSCRGTHLLPILSLGIEKGDRIRLSAPDGRADLSDLVRVLYQ